MCMLDDADGSVVTIDRGCYVTARKPHKCAECRRTIDAGERYNRESFVFDGCFQYHKTCAHCMVVRGFLVDECGGWLYGAVEEDAREHCHAGIYRMDLYRAVVGMGWNWRRKDGRLMNVPDRITTSDEIVSALKETQR